MGWIAFIEAAFKLAPILIQAGQELAPLAQKLVDSIRTKSEPTDEDWAELERIEKIARDTLQAPLD